MKPTAQGYDSLINPTIKVEFVLLERGIRFFEPLLRPDKGEPLT